MHNHKHRSITIKKTFLWELEQLQTDYVDFGFLHCVDEEEDFHDLVDMGLVQYLKELKDQKQYN